MNCACDLSAGLEWDNSGAMVADVAENVFDVVNLLLLDEEHEADDEDDAVDEEEEADDRDDDSLVLSCMFNSANFFI